MLLTDFVTCVKFARLIYHSLMTFRKVFLFLVIVTCLHLTSCAKKGNANKKKKKTSKKKTNKPDNTVQVVKIEDDDRVGPSKNEYSPGPDEDFWQPGGTQASYRLEDSPQHDPYFISLYDELREVVGLDRDNGMLIGSLELTTAQQEKHLEVYTRMITDLHIIDAFYKDSFLENKIFTIFGAHLDTRNGMELAGIFADSPACAPEICMDPVKHFAPFMSSPAYSQAHYFLPLGPTKVSTLAGMTLDKLEILLDLFPRNEVAEMICEGEEGPAWFDAMSRRIRYWLDDFLVDPAWAGPVNSDHIIADAHDYIGGVMIHDILQGICHEDN